MFITLEKLWKKCCVGEEWQSWEDPPLSTPSWNLHRAASAVYAEFVGTSGVRSLTAPTSPSSIASTRWSWRSHWRSSTRFGYEGAILPRSADRSDFTPRAASVTACPGQSSWSLASGTRCVASATKAAIAVQTVEFGVMWSQRQVLPQLRSNLELWQ